MNKLILVLLLAVCLITAHADIVKRDATEAPKPEFDFTKELNGIKQKIEEALSPEKMKETIKQVGAQINEGIKKLIPTETPKA